MGLGWFETKPKLEDERSGKRCVACGCWMFEGGKFLVPAELVVACGVVCKQGVAGQLFCSFANKNKF